MDRAKAELDDIFCDALELASPLLSGFRGIFPGVNDRSARLPGRSFLLQEVFP